VIGVEKITKVSVYIIMTRGPKCASFMWEL